MAITTIFIAVHTLRVHVRVRIHIHVSIRIHIHVRFRVHVLASTLMLTFEHAY